MRFVKSAVMVPLLSLFVAATALASSKSVIVELKQEPAAVAEAKARRAGVPMSEADVVSYRGSLRAAQDAFLTALRARGVAAEVLGVTLNNAAGQAARVDFRYTLVYNGLALSVPAAAVPAIEAMPEVKAVHDNKVLYTSSNISVPYIRAPEVYGAIRELTRSDNANEGFEGQGINISIIDTGIEWHHEQFGGDPTPPRLGIDPVNADIPTNGKVVYSLPLTDPASSDAFVADAFGHGTHVAATAAGYLGMAPGADLVAGTADDVPVHGVAPQAKLFSYKVCSDLRSTVSQGVNVGGCETAAILTAIEDSVSPTTVNGFPKPVAHVINMSLGGGGTPADPTAVASDNASLRGTVVVAAGGNSGPGESTVGTPCVGSRVVCVANSIDPTGGFSADVLDSSSFPVSTTGAVTNAQRFTTAAGQRVQMTYYPIAGTPAPPADGLAQYYVYVLGGETLANWPTSVRGRVALVQSTGQAYFAQITTNAAAAGAVAVLFRSEVPNGTAGAGVLPAGNLPPVDFDYLKGLLGGTNPHGVVSSFPVRLNPFFGTGMNGTSSRGPGDDYIQIKPDVTAPGTNILAAVPPASLLGVLAQGRYGSISGTSMASPHVAGAAALLRQAHPDWTPDMVRTVLANTATNLRRAGGAPKEDPAAERVMDQGAGLIDVVESVGAKALMGVVTNDGSAPSILGSHTFGDLTVAGTSSVTRSVQVTIRDLSGAGGSYALSVVDNRNSKLSGVTVTLSPAAVTVPANGEATYTVTVIIDGKLGQDTTSGPIHIEWYVKAVRNDNAETLRMPFHLRSPRHAAPVMTLSDDATPDQENGVDRDGNYTVSWTFPDGALQPCGFRVEEAVVSAENTLYSDDAEELMLNGSNTKWAGTNWNSRPHPVTGSLGYSPLYIDEQNLPLTKRGAIALPANARVLLAYDSFEDIEPGFDYIHTEISEDGGRTWRNVASFSGLFSGERRFDISQYAGKSVLLRFRLQSDLLISTPAHMGWVIDNIRVLASAGFAPVITVGADARTYDAVDHADGMYFTRVSAVYGDCDAPSLTVASNAADITINALRTPVASFTAGPNPSNAGQSVQFDASASADRDAEGGLPGVVRYSWSFGDGATLATTSPTTSHVYAAAGSYRVVLTVTDNDGQSASSESMQTVVQPNAQVSGGGWMHVTGGKATFSFDASYTAGLAGGSATWNDHARGLKLQSTRITNVQRNGSTATITGECTINKSRQTTFTMAVTDNGASGDALSIAFDDYAATGTVGGGGITVQE